MTLSTTGFSSDFTLLRTALDCAPGALFLLQIYPAASQTPDDFRIVLLNKAAENLARCPEGDLVGRSARRNLAALVPDHLWEKAFEVTATDEAYHELTWLTAPDDSRRRYDLTICPHPNGVALSYQDVTVFEEKKNLLEGIVTHSPNGIVVMEAVRETAPDGEPGPIRDFRTRFFNDRATEVLGVEAGYFQKNVFERQPEARRQLGALRALLETGGGIDQEYFYPLTQQWIDVRTRRLDENSFFSLYRDITQHKVIALELERQKTLLEGVMYNSLSAITVYEAVRDEAGTLVDFRVKLSNPASLRFSRRRAEDVLGKTMTEIYPATKTAGLWHRYAAVLETGQPDRVEHHYPHVDGWFDVSIARLGDGLVVTFNDITDRKRAELEILKQNALLNGVMNASLDGISVWESLRDASGQIADFRLLHINQTALNQLASAYGVIAPGKTLLEVNPASKITGSFYDQVAVVETGRPHQFEVHVPTENRWYELAITKLNDGNVVTHREITERKQVARKIEEQARLFNGVLDQVPCGLNVLEAVRDDTGDVVDWRYVVVAQPNLTDSGLTRADFMQNTMSTLFPGAVTTPYWSIQREVLATGVPQRFEVHYQLEGYDKYLDNSISRLDENRLISVYTLINEQKRAYQQVERQAAMLRSVLDGTQNPVVLFEAIRDDAGTIVDYRYLAQNVANSQAVGLPMDQMPHRTMLEVLPGLKATGIFDRYVAVTETGQPDRFEMPLEEVGIKGWYDLSVVKMGDGLVVSAADQTQLRQALANSERLVDELKRSNADLEQFAYVASHDLQEPLRKIQSFGERIDAKFGNVLGPDGRLYLERMRDASARMSLLINTLLDFSRLIRRNQTNRPTDLHQIMQSILIDLEVKISETGARVSVHPLPTIEAVPGQMHQLLQNLVINALKFSRPGVPPEIRVGTGPVSAEDRATHRLEGTRRYVKLTVADNGIGFETQYAEQIFVIFKRLHGRADYEGTGIGLAICKKIVENHDGVIFAEGQPGQGATFHVILPEK